MSASVTPGGEVARIKEDHMTIVDRRTLLRGAAAGAIVGGPFGGLVARAANAAGVDRERPPLEPVADLRDGQVRLWLPRHFQYRSFHDTESQVLLDDGTILPGRHDGMAAFRGRRGSVIL